jgi:serine/threonine protein kinase
MRSHFEPGRPLVDGRFVTTSPLNHGSFGMVFLAKDTLTGDDVAVKCITKPQAIGDAGACPASLAVDDRSEELAIHSRLANHPNIVNLIADMDTPNHQYMVLELCTNGDLYEAIRAGKGPLETENVRDLMLQLVSAVEYMHSKGVYHRDIKPENIFLTSTGSMKLGDFGLATTETWSTEFAVGSDRYMAPEQFDASVYGYGYSPAAADVWAIGIILLNVLFQRNPFATPTSNDPLFADFSRDRQSLFDIFPNMSYDTYSVLVHSLALDPANRSLAAVREALMTAVSFTTEDEALDEFCTDHHDAVPLATAAREPLRTPSVTSPALPGSDSFPWSSALLKVSPMATRQLSTIPDEDIDLFDSAATSDWQYGDADQASLSSAMDSGLGMSYKSAKSFELKPPMASRLKSSFVGSLPISFNRPSFKSPYGTTGFSKSWSDLWDEEMEQDEEFHDDLNMDHVDTITPSTPQPQSLPEDGRGSATPRQALANLSVNAAPSSKSTDVVKTPAELPKTLSSSILDKWAALGNFRRARPEPVLTAAAIPAQTTTRNTFGNFTPFSSSSSAKKNIPIKKDNTPPSRDRAPSWRQGSPQRLRSNNPSRIWQEDDNWRTPKAAKSFTSPSSPPSSTGVRYSPPHRKADVNLLDADSDDGNQWDGNFRNFHL